MKTFPCQCGSSLFIASSECVKCGLMLGFIPSDLQVSAFTKNRNGQWQASSNGLLYRKCKNYTDYDVCNWMVPIEDDNELCASCRLTEMIPNLDDPQNIQLWYRMEQAKRRLLYTLYSLGLPVTSRYDDPENGVGFAFLEDQLDDEFGNELFIKNFVATGHSSGLITINLNEAEHGTRVEMREKMNERYRTLVGHFRHESGHYYWDRLIKNTDNIEPFRRLFGDERIDYQQALRQHYDEGPKQNWQNVWISAYASMHPWEDWAETWAHYLHMLDTLETANDYDFSISGLKVVDPLATHHQHDDDYIATSFTHLFDDWCRLTAALNALNRSMGLDDAYPFVISITALDKLRFVHEVVQSAHQSPDD